MGPHKARNGYPACVFTHDSAASRRRRHRVTSIVALTAAWLVGGAVLDAAAADTPAGWENAPDVTGFDYLLVLVLIPLGLAAVISFLAFLPTLASDHGYQPGQTWRNESEWFGGPRRGVAAADDVSREQLEAGSKGAGGTSGRW